MERMEQMCGGKMILRSKIGEGACITLLIPDGSKGNTKENLHESDLRR